MYELTIITRFAAAHQLKMVNSKCENLHGHNWRVEVRLTGDTLDAAGVLVDFGVVKKHVAEIVSRLDHHYLNELTYFQKDQPTSENIAAFIARELQRKLDDPALTVSRVTAWESEDAGATFILPSGADP